MPKYLLGETEFQLREFPRSGSKAEDVKEEERSKVNDYNGPYMSPELKCETETLP